MYHLKISGLTVLESDLRGRRLEEDRPVLSDVSLSVLRGEIFGITGPNGCGKTTLLRAIAGLTDFSGGEILCDGENLAAVKPSCRGIGMVFQEFSLYPDMTGRQNVAFPLHIRNGLPISPDRRLAAGMARDPEGDLFRIASMLRLDHRKILDRKPKAVSIGERQRIAVGKALASRPDILMMDEPFSNIEEDLRDELRARLKIFLEERGVTTLFVSNNPREIGSFAETVAVMEDGRVDQAGTFRDLYDNPRTLAVARYLGDVRPNIVPPEILETRCPGLSGLLMAVRPERCVLGGRPDAFQVAGEISFIQRFMPERRQAVFVEFGKELFGVILPLDHTAAKGERIVISAPYADGMFFRENHEGTRERVYNISVSGSC